MAQSFTDCLGRQHLASTSREGSGSADQLLGIPALMRGPGVLRLGMGTGCQQSWPTGLSLSYTPSECWLQGAEGRREGRVRCPKKRVKRKRQRKKSRSHTCLWQRKKGTGRGRHREGEAALEGSHIPSPHCQGKCEHTSTYTYKSRDQGMCEDTSTHIHKSRDPGDSPTGHEQTHLTETNGDPRTGSP